MLSTLYQQFTAGLFVEGCKNLSSPMVLSTHARCQQKFACSHAQQVKGCGLMDELAHF